MTNEQIEEYSNLILSLTHYFEGYKSKEDLFQVGIIGLIEAYNRFDERFGAKFSTYAYPYILGEMKKLVREDRGIKISRNITKLNIQIEKAKLILVQKLLREPTINELSCFLEIEEDKIIEALKTINILQSLDEPITKDGKELTYHDTISDNKMDLDILLAFKHELNSLSSFEKELINKRYIEDLTQSEVAREFGITQVKVSRSEQKIKEKIKHNLAF